MKGYMKCNGREDNARGATGNRELTCSISPLRARMSDPWSLSIDEDIAHLSVGLSVQSDHSATAMQKNNSL